MNEYYVQIRPHDPHASTWEVRLEKLVAQYLRKDGGKAGRADFSFKAYRLPDDRRADDLNLRLSLQRLDDGANISISLQSLLQNSGDRRLISLVENYRDKYSFQLASAEASYVPVPSPKHAFNVHEPGRDAPSFLNVTRVEEQLPPEKSLADFSVERRIPGFHPHVQVLIARNVYDQLVFDPFYSRQVEEGGFLVGPIYRDRDSPNGWIVVVRAAWEAVSTGASAYHLTFTGDSFSELKRQLNEERPSEKLLGGYHTHLFPEAGEEVGLSSVDFAMHFSTFSKRWQLAGLINLNRAAPHSLRFYARHDTTMRLCALGIIPA